MDWRAWFDDIGVHIPVSPDVESIIVAVVLIAGCAAIGWFVGSRAAIRLVERVPSLKASATGVPSKDVGVIVQYIVAALLLLVVGHTVALSPVAVIILASALGVLVGLLARRIVKLFRIGGLIALVVAVVACVATTAGTLGGMDPLIDGLDAIAFTVGTRRVSLLSVINAIVIIVIIFVVAKAVNHLLSHAIGRASKLDISQRVLVQKLAGVAVSALAFMLGVDLLGIDLTALTVFSGAVGLAIGFGLQKTFGNLISGLILLMDKSVKPGDVIVVGDTFGAISKIGIRAVSVVTRDGKEHLIPNEQLMTESVENWSYSSRNVRVHIPVGVSYSSDITLAQKLMIEAATAADRVLSEPKPSVWLTGFGDSSVDHDILAWISDPEMGVGNVRSDILNRVWVLFAENGIEIPFPQRDLHIRTMPPIGKDEAP